MSLLSVRDLRVRAGSGPGAVTIVHGVDLDLEPGRILGIAGESGSGKTMTGLAVMGLLPPIMNVTGRILFDGTDLLGCDERAMNRLRGDAISMIFQDATAALHPMLTIGHQLTDHMRRHLGLSRRAARLRAADLLHRVRIPDPSRILDAYPSQLSGGMRQRVCIAIALACDPKLIIADEPTTALDVTVQAGIVELLHDLCRDGGLALMVVTHDLGVLSALADEVAVFYAGRVIEKAPRAELFGNPAHPYTRKLLDALPHPEAGDQQNLGMTPLPGSPPPADALPPGCAFTPRCDRALGGCTAEPPALLPLTAVPGHAVACANPLERVS